MRAILASLDKVGYREEKVVLADIVDIISRVDTSLNSLTKRCLNNAHSCSKISLTTVQSTLRCT